MANIRDQFGVWGRARADAERPFIFFIGGKVKIRNR